MDVKMGSRLRSVTLVALFTALICVGAFIAVPIGLGPVPIVLQNMLVLLTGLLLGPLRGSAAVGLFLISGLIGLPVFSGGRSGPAHFAGPAGGYLVGYLLAAFVTGILNRGSGRSRIMPILASLAGAFVIYVPAVIWLRIILVPDWLKAVVGGTTPYIIPDLVKAVIAGLLAIVLRPSVDEALGKRS
jgi:biotin transport system substrate-specific component